MTALAVAALTVVAAAATEAVAQCCLKVSRTARLRPRLWIALGLFAYTIEVALYTLALRRIDVSIAFPLGALSFVFVTVLARWPLGETVGPRRWIGSLLILAGAALISLDLGQ